MFLSLSFSLPLPLKINKYNLKNKQTNPKPAMAQETALKAPSTLTPGFQTHLPAPIRAVSRQMPSAPGAGLCVRMAEGVTRGSEQKASVWPVVRTHEMAFRGPMEKVNRNGMVVYPP